MCLADGPSVEVDVNQYYQQRNPGQVQVVGVDLWDGTPGACGNFKTQTGATYPILLLGSSAAGGNFSTLYGPWDNYVIVNKQGIVRYHADIAWDHGNRYHLDEIRGCVDSLVSSTVGVDAGPSVALALAAAPNPFRQGTTVELAQPDAGTARVTVHDLMGRRVATLHDGPLGAGVTRLDWNGRGDGGAALAAGVYLVHAQVGRERLSRRIVFVR